MAEKPILFSGEMVKAILSASKTQTRRIIKPQPTDDEGNVWVGRILGPGMYEPEVYDRYGEAHPGKPIYGIYDEYGDWGIKCPYAPGDTLWVRETHWLDCYPDGVLVDGKPAHVHYRAAHPYPAIAKSIDGHWRPSIFMPRWASRITLEITAVRVERVQDISEDDAKAEGVTPVPFTDSGWDSSELYRNSFAELWDSINAKRGYGWDVNPWCWVVEFTPS